MSSCALAKFHTALWAKKIQRIRRMVFQNQFQNDLQKSPIKYSLQIKMDSL